MEPTTTCDRTTELLPWLLNASLEDSERREVEDHLRTCAGCRRALAETRGAFELFAVHPPVEAIVARAALDEPWVETVDFAGGRIGREALDAHLENCAGCREELELARDSRRAIEGEAEPSSEGRPGVVVPLARPGRSAGAGARAGLDWRPLALAASLLLAVVAGGGWLFTAQEAADRQARIEELERRTAPAPDGSVEGADPAETGAAGATIAELEAQIGELARSAEAASASVDAAERQLAGLEDANESLREALARSPQVLQIATPVVQRGGPGERPEVSRSAGRAVVTVYTELAEIELGSGRLSWRLSGAGGGTLAEGGPLTRFRDPLGGEYVSVPLVTGELPAGEATLTLLEDGREVADLRLRVVG